MRSLRPRGGLWGHTDFLRLWTGQSISEFGSQISALAIPWLAAVELHASAFEFSVLSSLRAGQLTRGCTPRVDGDHKLAVTAQREIAEYKVVRSAPEAATDSVK